MKMNERVLNTHTKKKIFKKEDKLNDPKHTRKKRKTIQRADKLKEETEKKNNRCSFDTLPELLTLLGNLWKDSPTSNLSKVVIKMFSIWIRRSSR